MTRILAICGSLRKASYNRATLEAIASLCPAVTLDIRLLRDIPMYDADDLEANGVPQAVTDLRLEILGADALLIATPEYSHSVSGVLKNALDWLHGRPPHLMGKPVAIVSAATSPMGGIRAQYDLREILQPLGAFVLGMPEVAIGGAQRKFDDNGALIDGATADALIAFMSAYVGWIELVRGTPVTL